MKNLMKSAIIALALVASSAYASTLTFKVINNTKDTVEVLNAGTHPNIDLNFTYTALQPGAQTTITLKKIDNMPGLAGYAGIEVLDDVMGDSSLNYFISQAQAGTGPFNFSTQLSGYGLTSAVTSSDGNTSSWDYNNDKTVTVTVSAK